MTRVVVVGSGGREHALADVLGALAAVAGPRWDQQRADAFATRATGAPGSVGIDLTVAR